ncbi:MAG: hypothetical protein DIZ80_06465 [endosymbiont of Galathealinum brachiosum]|uniref:Uncharacterized protein n=1 Tax=endosymbiont of Galathealinum brachiosum TaxID=2200906 RepID=A0A370DHH4_9GAMM|nr:MAG: hypothetical protein DIZ80_06465 [endosymbiont of Galathealinum brachiosum]
MSNKSDIGRFFKHSGIYAFGNILNRIGAFLLLPIYTTYLTVANYGALELFYTISAVISGILAVGIAHATLRFYFEYDKQTDRNAVVSTNLIVSALIALVGVSIAFYFDNKIAAFVFDTVDDNVLMGLYIVLATMVLELSSQVCLAYLRARELSVFYVLLSFVKLVIQVSINSYLVIVEGMGIVGILAGNFVAVFIGWLMLICYTLYCCGFQFHLDKMKSIVVYSFPFLLGTLVSIVAVNADRFMLNMFMGLEAVGIYALALKLTLLIEVLVAEPFSKSYGAYRFSIMKNDDADHTQKRITGYMSLIVSIVLILIVYSSHEIITLMSSPEFYTAVTILPVLIFIGGFKVFTYIFQTGILYKKATKHIFTLSVIGCISIIILNYIFINAYGLIGACIAKVLASAIVLFSTNYISQRYMKIDYAYFDLFKVLFITILFIVLGVLANDLDFWVAIGSKLVLFGLLIITLFYSGVLNKTDKEKGFNFIKSQISKNK